MKTNAIANTNKTTSFSQALLWLGAAISIAEIQTGALLAPLGISKGLTAIVIGHVIGVITLYLAGMIGAESKLSSMESTRLSFGTYGSFGFSILNILQLLGWTAIMIINGANALDELTAKIFHFQNEKLWCVLIGAFICIWIAVGIKNLSKVNLFVIGVLFGLTVILGFTVFNATAIGKAAQGFLTFGDGVELNVAMSLSWLPLIADYTRNVTHKKAGTICSVLGYFAGSIFMFIIGLGAAIYAGTSDISVILISSGLGIAALIIVLFSTITTTFLDAYSAGVSAVNLNVKIPEKPAALVTCVIGIIIAILIPINQYENFLYFIGSVFAPLFAILIMDYFIFKKRIIDPKCLLNLKNTLIWIIGVIIYRFLLLYNSPLGSTLPVIIALCILCILVNGGIKLWTKKFESL